MPLDLHYTPQAVADLESIFSFIAEDSPQRARDYVGRSGRHAQA
jgi:plasmid stabilization system protein ParE